MRTLKKLTNTIIITTAFSMSACSFSSTTKHNGKVIEFTSKAAGFHTKTVFYEGAKEVVAIDAQFTEDLAREAFKKRG